ncbi:MAG TPA: flagellar motor protein MotB [Pseudogracilibacillus sp.]|nr:flagellar motor protein MotB [Pseudogracilibacillus sp.]
MSKRKRNKKTEEKMDESWLLPYADMLTLLLALFIVLFAMSEVDSRKFQRLAYVFQSEFMSGSGVIDDGETIIPEETPADLVEDLEQGKDKDFEEEKESTDEGILEYEKLLGMQERVDEYITDNDLTDILGTELTGEGLLITVRTDITFDSGSAQVKETGREIAEEIANLIFTDAPHEIVVNGHADDRPMHNNEFASNWELSSMRAIQFLYLLLDYSELDPKWFSARGYGEFQPMVPNTSEANRAVNRRVEVLILPNHDIEAELEV